MGDDTAHWEDSGRIPPQVGPKADGTTTFERDGRWVVVSPSGVSDGGGGVTGGVDLRLPPPEQIRKFHCNQAHYGPVSVSGEASRVTGGQSVVGTGWLGIGRDN